eukprot:Gb_07188 [translate_table: standard]
MTSSEANTFPDIWEWINGLPPPTEWKSDIMSVKLCGCPRPCNPRDSNTMFGTLLLDFINGILQYGPEPAAEANIMDATAIVREWRDKLRDMLNYAEIVNRWNTNGLLLQALGADIEQHLVRSMGLMTTNCLFDAISKQDTSNLNVWEKSIESPYMYSYSSTANGFWKVRLYSPLLSMKDDRDHRDQLQCAIPIKDDRRLLFALRYQHLEALASSALMEKRGIPEEKHFPSKISVNIAPPSTGILFMSLSKSSDNPTHELIRERSVEMGFEWPKAFKVTASEASFMSMKPWKMEQSGRGNVGTFEWILYDTINGKEVAGSKPSKTAMYQHKAWFKDRYSNSSKPFTRQGGVVFAGDEYSKSIIWIVRNDMEGKTLKWEVGGRIWVTYWPNKYKTSYSETRYVDFCEQVELPLLQQLIE